MNLPNKLTIFRMVLIPFFVVLMKIPFGDGLNRYIALAVFVIASLTDTLDGYIARRDNLVTDFGKFMDPLADKLLVCAAMICLIDTGQLPSWVVIVIISREFIISGFRLIAADNGIVIAASKWGKIKTICQMAMIIFLLLGIGGFAAWVIGQVLIWLALALTIISLLDYLIKNRQVMSSQK
jgi:CDP-diacylglycerol--glycerol-3-phosphate 3-phosphatidyltransferase